VNVDVDSAKVQQSGLLKDTIMRSTSRTKHRAISTRCWSGGLPTRCKEITANWKAYVEQQDDGESVTPLMVLQVPNKPDHNEIGSALQTSSLSSGRSYRRSQWRTSSASTDTDLRQATRCLTSQPERVQDETWVRVLIAKDAISTGWDCPRAEVMVSFRPAKDQTYITQMLGRMVRSPLGAAHPRQRPAQRCGLPSAQVRLGRPSMRSSRPCAMAAGKPRRRAVF
jgi:type III restriction enzyme